MFCGSITGLRHVFLVRAGGLLRRHFEKKHGDRRMEGGKEYKLSTEVREGTVLGQRKAEREGREGEEGQD